MQSRPFSDLQISRLCSCLLPHKRQPAVSSEAAGSSCGAACSSSFLAGFAPQAAAAGSERKGENEECWAIYRVGHNHIFMYIYGECIYGVHTVFLAGKSPYIWS